MIAQRESLAARLAELSNEQRAALVRRLAAADRIPRRRPGEQPPLSLAQWRLWFLDQLTPGAPAYNSPVAVRLRGPLHAGALRRALGIVVERHESLRTAIVSDSGEPRALVREHAEAALEQEDLLATQPQEREAALGERIRDEIRRPFDLGADTLVRGRLLRLGAEEHVLVLVAHHIACDGWSKAILLDELGRAYDALVTGAELDLPELPIQYGDFAAWQQRTLTGARLEELGRFWACALANHPHELALETDRPRPPVLSGDGAVEWMAVDGELARAAERVGRSVRATPFMTMLGAFACLLAAETGERDILIGAPSAMRERPETERLIGFFANTLVYRVDASGDPSFRTLLGRVRRTALDAYAHQELPFDRIVRVAQPRRDPSRRPLVQVNLRLEGPEPELRLHGLHTGRLAIDPGIARFELALELAAAGPDGGLEGYLEYATDLFERPTARRLAKRFSSLLAAATSEPDAPISSLIEADGG